MPAISIGAFYCPSLVYLRTASRSTRWDVGSAGAEGRAGPGFREIKRWFAVLRGCGLQPDRPEGGRFGSADQSRYCPERLLLMNTICCSPDAAGLAGVKAS